MAGVFKRMRFAEITINTLSEGEISELHVGLKGTMNALLLKDLADKTRRGLRGRIEAGRSGDGKSFGNKVLRVNGSIEAGERQINAAEAEIVQRIFRDYVSSVSPREIASRSIERELRGPLAQPGVPRRLTAMHRAERAFSTMSCTLVASSGTG